MATSKPSVTVRVLAFARLRELLGAHECVESLPVGASLDLLWAQLVGRRPQLAGLAASTRFAINGRIVAGSQALAEGDEVALLPPVGGG